ncbi:extracellular solute-binding protein [Bianquea renquensis]|uniref:Extracellular solute-binding protein n=1 Tax=Bianquea renquensis TaxID=2763661 RepID=A0A926HY77_9FIRM|nr:extracellular solute-binding protein [Bianquea renquensis]MBC8544547.1 extracellular solute-binding protein [Bianquea renquensis]
MKKKCIAAVLVGLILSTTMAGCKGNGSEVSKPDASSTTSESSQGAESTSNIKPGEIVEISMSVLDRGGIPAERGTYTDNDAIDYMNEQMEPKGVKISTVPVPRAQSRDKLNAMIAAGTAPDIIWEYSRPWMDQLRVQKVILPIEDLIEKYSTSYKEYYEEHKDLMESYLRLEDGKIYAFSSLRAANALPTAGVWYRQDLLDEVGAEVPSTLEEVIEVSNKVKEKHPDIVPIAASYLHYLNIIKGTYGYFSNEIMKDGELIHPIFSDNYRDAMEMARKLYQEKITDQEYLVDTTSARQQQLWTSGQAIFFFNSANMPGGTKEMVQTVDGADPYPLPPLESQYGQFMLTPQSATRFYVMLNNKIDEKKQEAAIRYIDWVIAEGWKVINYGYEGQQYTLTEEGLRKSIPGAPKWPFGEMALLTQETFTFGQSKLGETDEKYQYLSERNDKGLKEMMSYPIPTGLPYDYSSDAYAEFTASFSPKIEEIEAKMVSEVDYSVEAGIKELQSIYEELGGAEIWKEKNEWYQANKETLANFAESYDAYKSSLLQNSVLE